MYVCYKKLLIKRCLCGILAAVLLFALCIPALALSSSPTVRIGFYSMPGLQNVDENGNLSGYMYDYLQEISKHTGWKYEFYTGNFSDCLEKLETGELDFMSGMQKTDERKALFEFPNYSCGEMYVALYVKDDNFKYAYGDVESFEGLSVGIIKGFASNQYFNDYCEKNNITVNITEYSSEDRLMTALENGEVEAICTLSCNTKLRCIAGFSYNNFYMMATKGKTSLVSELDRAIEEIKVENPFYEKNLWEQYFSVKKEKTPVYTRAEQEYLKNSQTITAVYNKDMIPLERHNEETGEFEGITAGIFQLISEMSGLNFRFIAEDDYANAYERLKNKNVQIMCSTVRACLESF